MVLSQLASRFHALFQRDARAVRAPGRVNLIGEHTDYNAGLVMPVAISFYTWALVSPRTDGVLRVHSTSFGETTERRIGEPPAADAGHRWSDYVHGVAADLLAHGYPLAGADLLVHGNVPIGSGLSSSAALEVATAYALLDAAAVPRPSPLEIARTCQRAENEYVGMRCGIMDQFASACGVAGHALKLDCRTLEHEAVPLHPAGTRAYRLVICNTMVRHRLAGGEYNRRRAECDAGVAALARLDPGVRSLRDVTPELLAAAVEILDPLILRRCRHVVAENARVEASAVALRSGDLGQFGDLMAASHASLRDDYEVSCDELDLMVRLACSVPGVYGARMTGGGFGGCTVNLVAPEALDAFRSTVTADYRRATGHAPEIYVCDSAEGAAGTGPLAVGENSDVH